MSHTFCSSGSVNGFPVLDGGPFDAHPSAYPAAETSMLSLDTVSMWLNLLGEGGGFSDRRILDGFAFFFTIFLMVLLGMFY